MPEKTILDVIVLVQDGKIIAEPSSDNYQVHPLLREAASEGGQAAIVDSQAILRALKAKHPMCAFTWFANPIKPEVNDPPDPSTPSKVNQPPPGSEVGRAVPGEPSSAPALSGDASEAKTDAAQESKKSKISNFFRGPKS